MEPENQSQIEPQNPTPPENPAASPAEAALEPEPAKTIPEISPSDTLPVPETPPPPAMPKETRPDLFELRLKANFKRKQKRTQHLAQIEELAAQKGKFTNQAVRDLLHISQSSATNYLRALVTSGQLQKFGRGRASYYQKPNLSS